MFSVNNKKALGNALNTCLRTGDGFPEDQAEAPPWCSGFEGSVLPDCCLLFRENQALQPEGRDSCFLNHH